MPYNLLHGHLCVKNGFLHSQLAITLQVAELRSCVKVEVDVLGSPSLTVLMISVDVKHPCIELQASLFGAFF